MAIARALAKKPSLLLCDEPTGALNYETGIQILSLLREANAVYGTTVVIITHNLAIADMADRVFRMRSGQIVEVLGKVTLPGGGGTGKNSFAACQGLRYNSDSEGEPLAGRGPQAQSRMPN